MSFGTVPKTYYLVKESQNALLYYHLFEKALKQTYQPTDRMSETPSRERHTVMRNCYRIVFKLMFTRRSIRIEKDSFTLNSRVIWGIDQSNIYEKPRSYETSQ